MQVIGLTGGIATGKSTVSDILKNTGALVIDADRIARASVKKGLPAYREIVRNFGTKILLPNGEIDRGALGEMIFSDPRKKQLLDSIVHPRVRTEINRQLKQIGKTDPNAIVFVDIPLLIEAEMHKDFSEVIVVYAPENIQIKRLIQRDSVSEAEALARIRSQMPIEEKKKQATIVIDNSGAMKHTRRQTLEMVKRLKDSAP